MNRLLVIIFALSIWIGTVEAAPPTTAQPTRSVKKEDDPVMLKYGVPSEKVIGFLKDCTTKINEGSNNGKPIQYLIYGLWESQLNRWGNYTYFELDSGLSRQWVIALAKLFEYMGNCRRTLNELESAKKTASPEYQTTLNNFNVALQRVKTATERPMQANLTGETTKALRSAKKDALERLNARVDAPPVRQPAKPKK